MYYNIITYIFGEWANSDFCLVTKCPKNDNIFNVQTRTAFHWDAWLAVKAYH